MQENDFTRHKRERDFQARILSKFDGRRSRIMSFLNSRLFVWALTACGLTLGSAYFSQRQQCITQSEQIIDKRERLGAEMDTRRRAIARLGANAKSVDEIKVGLNSLPHAYPEFKERTLLDITHDFASLNRYIDESRASPLEEALSERIEPIKKTQYVLNFSLFMGRLPDQSYSLDDLKEFSRKYFEGDRIRSLTQRLSVLTPDCSSRHIISSLMEGGSRASVTQTPMIDAEYVRRLHKNADILYFEIERGPGLRPPFVKISPDINAQ